MALETLILEVGRTYQAHELNGFANSERLQDIQYFTYISFEPNSIPRKISQHYEVTADVHHQPQTAEELYPIKSGGALVSRERGSSSKPQDNLNRVGTSKKEACGAGGYDNNGPAELDVVSALMSPRPGGSNPHFQSQEGRYFSIIRIYDCTNGPFQSVERMEFRREGALSLVDRFRMAEGNVVRGYN